jgi:acetoin utilization deacetylase AcuC-like enzyme
LKTFPDYARASVAAALDAMKAARAGENVFSLMRPPGHHATREKSMGFCYLNNIAIAALEALATGSKRVAVFDFDVHHGNGTEDILLNRRRRRVFFRPPASRVSRHGRKKSPAKIVSIIPSRRPRRARPIAPRSRARSTI